MRQQRAGGGGTEWDNETADEELYTVEAYLDTTPPLPDQYFAWGANDTADNETFRVWIYCLDADPSP
jgi:hypothetical protein